MGDPVDEVAHLALHLGHGGDQARRVRGLGHPDVEMDVGAAVVVERPRLFHAHGQAVEALEVLLLGALGREDGCARLHGNAIVQHGAGILGEHLTLGGLSEGRLVGHEGAARPASQRHQVPALYERRQSLTQGRARYAQLLGEIALRWKATRGHEQSETDRCAETLDGLLERRWWLDRFEHRLEGRRPLRPACRFHASKPTPASRSSGPAALDSLPWRTAGNAWWWRPTATGWKD